MAKRLSTLLLLISVFTTLSAQHSTELGFYPVFTTLEFSEVLEKFPTTIKQKIIYRNEDTIANTSDTISANEDVIITDSTDNILAFFYSVLPRDTALVGRYIRAQQLTNKKLKGTKLFWHPSDEYPSEVYLVLAKVDSEYKLVNPILTNLEKIKSGEGMYSCHLQFAHQDGLKWAHLTWEAIGSAIAIVVDNKVTNLPIVNQMISGNRAAIDVSSEETMNWLYDKLTSLIAADPFQPLWKPDYKVGEKYTYNITETKAKHIGKFTIEVKERTAEGWKMEAILKDFHLLDDNENIAKMPDAADLLKLFRNTFNTLINRPITLRLDKYGNYNLMETERQLNEIWGKSIQTQMETFVKEKYPQYKTMKEFFASTEGKDMGMVIIALLSNINPALYHIPLQNLFALNNQVALGKQKGELFNLGVLANYTLASPMQKDNTYTVNVKESTVSGSHNYIVTTDGWVTKFSAPILTEEPWIVIRE